MNSGDKVPQTQAGAAARPRVKASEWAGIVGNDISRISTNVDNLAASFHDLVMENKQLIEERDELLEDNEKQTQRLKELTLELKLIGEQPKAAQADSSN